MAWISAGPVDGLPADRCHTIADGSVLVFMTAEGPRALTNRCLHQGSAMGEAWIRDGALWCPLHFWRYDVVTGKLLSEQGVGLDSYPVEVRGGEVFVDVPERTEPLSFRDKQLKHAAEWKRDR